MTSRLRFEDLLEDEDDLPAPAAQSSTSATSPVDSHLDFELEFSNAHDPVGQVEQFLENGIGAAPPTNRTFTTWKEGQQYCQQWARDHGYALRVRTSTREKYPDGHKGLTYYGLLICEAGDKRRDYHTEQQEENLKRRLHSKRDHCPFAIIISRTPCEPDERFTMKIKRGDHDCVLTTLPTAHAIHRRQYREGLLADIRIKRAGGTVARAYYDAEMVKNPEAPVTLKDVENAFATVRDETLEGRPAIQAVMHKLQNDENWLFDYCYNDLHQIERLVFFHKRCVQLLHLFPESLVLDGTFKTNRFNMTLINTVGLTATNETFLCGQALLAHEDTTDYVWLLEWLKKLYVTRKIPLPSSITSDKESGLLPAMKQVFPEAAHLLCVWHVNTDIEKWCLKHYRKEADTIHWKAQQSFAQKTWTAISKAWARVLYAKTEADFEARWDDMKAKFSDEKHTALIQYIAKTWLTHKEKLIKAWTDLVRHFGNSASNRVEGIHHAVKRWLKNRRGHLIDVVEAFQRYIIGHINGLLKSLDTAQRDVLPHLRRNILFTQLHRVISPFAMELVEQERSRVNLTYEAPEEATLLPCTHRMRKSMGLPCQHTIRDRMRQQTSLQIADFAGQWRVNRLATIPSLHEFDLLRDPQRIPIREPKKVRQSKKHGTKRLEIGVELARTANATNPVTGGQTGSKRRTTNTQGELEVGRLTQDRGLQELSQAIEISSDEDELAPTPAPVPVTPPPAAKRQRQQQEVYDIDDLPEMDVDTAREMQARWNQRHGRVRRIFNSEGDQGPA
jgi:hypothetical protein